MESTNNCILLKKKEYEDLKAKALANKPDYIRIELGTVNPYGSAIMSNLDLSNKLRDQILQLRHLIRVEINKTRRMEQDNGRYLLLQELKKMSWWKKYTFLKSIK